MALDFTGLMGSLGSLVQGASGLMMENQGANLSVQGANYTAANYATAGSIALQSSGYTAEQYRQAGAVAMQGANYQKEVLTQAKQQALEGSAYTAQVFSNAGAAKVAEATYNSALVDVDTNRTLDAMGRQINSLFSTNTASQGSSGTAIGGKGYLSVMNDAMSNFERTVVQTRSNAQLKQTAIKYGGQEAAADSLNNANAAIYQGKVAAYNFDNQITGAMYQASVAQYSYNNEAIAADYQGTIENYNDQVKAQGAVYQGQVAAYQEEVKQSQQMGKVIGNVVSLF